jgi:hypothetical protein
VLLFVVCCVCWCTGIGGVGGAVAVLGMLKHTPRRGDECFSVSLEVCKCR